MGAARFYRLRQQCRLQTPHKAAKRLSESQAAFPRSLSVFVSHSLGVYLPLPLSLCLLDPSHLAKQDVALWHLFTCSQFVFTVFLLSLLTARWCLRPSTYDDVDFVLCSCSLIAFQPQLQCASISFPFRIPFTQFPLSSFPSGFLFSTAC